MTKKTNIHWLAPTWMISALLSGIGFALGHHFFYQSLSGTLAPTLEDHYTILGSTLAKQQFNIAVGNSFAFLIKACLVFSVSSAYIQAVWSAVKHDKRLPTIGSMDVVFSALGNALSLGNISVWRRQPMLLGIALVAWLIPLASIVTPATLSVAIRTPPDQDVRVPDIAFQSLKMLADMTRANPGADLYMYNGPSYAVSSMAQAVAATGSILTVKAPASDASWSTSFPGPVLKCESIEGLTRHIFAESIANYTCDNRTAGSLGYVAWRGPPDSRSYDHENDTQKARLFAPFTQADERNASSPWVLSEPPLVDRFRRTNQSFYMFASTAPLEQKGTDFETFCDVHAESVAELIDPTRATMLKCDLYNGTYEVSFNLVDGTQSAHINILNQNHSTQELVASVWGTTGYQLRTENDCDTLQPEEILNDGANCIFDTSVLAGLSYQAIMDAFTATLTGTVSNQAYDERGESLVFNTMVSSTILTQTPQLSFMRNASIYRLERNSTNPSDVELHEVDILQRLPFKDDSLFDGLGSEATNTLKLSLLEALEELFQNITVSMMSSPLLQTSDSSAFQPRTSRVTFRTRENVYFYAAYKLWLAYGLAIAVTFLIVILGCTIMVVRDASYSNNFSTNLRLVKEANLSVDIADGDLSGKDPLPTYLKEASISFEAKKRQSDSEHAYSAIKQSTNSEEDEWHSRTEETEAVKHTIAYRQTL